MPRAGLLGASPKMLLFRWVGGLNTDPPGRTRRKQSVSCRVVPREEKPSRAFLLEILSTVRGNTESALLFLFVCFCPSLFYSGNGAPTIPPSCRAQLLALGTSIQCSFRSLPFCLRPVLVPRDISGPPPRRFYPRPRPFYPRDISGPCSLVPCASAPPRGARPVYATFGPNDFLDADFLFLSDVRKITFTSCRDGDFSEREGRPRKWAIAIFAKWTFSRGDPTLISLHIVLSLTMTSLLVTAFTSYVSTTRKITFSE